MANNSKEATQITYSRLNKALATLGFVRKETKEFTAYREAEHGALIVLPSMSDDSTLGAPHLVTIRNTVTGKGIASLDEFQMLLISPPVKPTAMKLKLQAAKQHRTFVKPRKARRPSTAARNQQSALLEKTSSQ